jgi:hypothetical protein
LIRVNISFAGHDLAFDLNATTKTWAALEASAHDLLDEGDFPLIAISSGKRYELYSNGTFAEVEL